MKNTKWYAQVNSQRIGPVSAETLQRMLESQEISEATYVYTKGMDNWMQLKDSPFHRQMLASVFDIKNDEAPVLKPKKKTEAVKKEELPTEQRETAETVKNTDTATSVETEKMGNANELPKKKDSLPSRTKEKTEESETREDIFSPQRFPLTKKTLIIYMIISLLLSIIMVCLSNVIIGALIDNGVITVTTSEKDTDFDGYDRDSDYFNDSRQDSAYVDNAFTSSNNSEVRKDD